MERVRLKTFRMSLSNYDTESQKESVSDIKEELAKRVINQQRQLKAMVE